VRIRPTADTLDELEQFIDTSERELAAKQKELDDLRSQLEHLA